MRILACQCLCFTVFALYDTQFAFWFSMAGALVIQPNYSMTKKRVKLRTLGTIFGAIVSGILYANSSWSQEFIIFISATSLSLFWFTRSLNYGFSTTFLTISVFSTFHLAGVALG